MLRVALLLAIVACRKQAPVAGDAGLSPGPIERIPDAAVGGVVDDPQFHVRPGEASVTITPAHASIGTPARATVSIVPGPGFHLSTEYKAKLDLGPTATVAVTGRTEQRLSFDISTTPKVEGEQHIEGFLHVGICEAKSCRPRKQPVSISVVGD